jgi:hypothetical protein
MDTGQMGLPHEASDLVVRAYARYSARTLVRYGKAYEPTFNPTIPDDVVLEKPELPSASEWMAALENAGHLFGITLAGKALHADNLRRFESELASKLQAVAPSASALPGLLKTRMGELGIGEGTDRAETAESGRALCAALQGKPAIEQVRFLASFRAETSAKALGRSLANAAESVRALEDRLVFGTLVQLRNLGPAAADILEQVVRVMRQDEIHETLAARLRTLAVAGAERLASGKAVVSQGGEPAPAPHPGIGSSLLRPRHAPATRRDLPRVAEMLARDLQHALDDSLEADASLVVTVSVALKDKP